jgi:hypothetical protein
MFNSSAPLSSWQGVYQPSPYTTDANGWVQCDGVYVPTALTFVDPTPTTSNARLFYRLESALSPTP